MQLYGIFIYVSIHPMCRFKPYGSSHPLQNWRFQYILCVGSRLCQILLLKVQKSFNTSYVSVQDSNELAIKEMLESFNTSYVSVQETGYIDPNNVLMFQYILCVGSSVLERECRVTEYGFQYILCVGSSYHLTLIAHIFYCFNTSYVSVQVKYYGGI